MADTHTTTDPGDTPSVAEIADMLAQLRDISGRLARFEDIPQADLDAFEITKRMLVERIEPGFYDEEPAEAQIAQALSDFGAEPGPQIVSSADEIGQPVADLGEGEAGVCRCGHEPFNHDDRVHGSGDDAGACRRCQCAGFTLGRAGAAALARRAHDHQRADQ